MSLDTPSLESGLKAFERGEAEREFWREHWDDFVQKYPDQFVAVSNGEVIASSPDLMDLLAILERNGLGAKDVWTQFIRADWRSLVL